MAGKVTQQLSADPAPQSDLAQQVFREPMNLEFLALSEQASERELERGLIERLKDFGTRGGLCFCEQPAPPGGEAELLIGPVVLSPETAVPGKLLQDRPFKG